MRVVLGPLLGLLASFVSVCAAEATNYSVLYSFQNDGADGMEPYAGVVAAKGKLYGTTEFGGTGTCTQVPPYGCGVVFALDPATGAEDILHSFQNDGKDGQIPEAGLLKSGGTLYGTTLEGGSKDRGTVFSIDRKTGFETVLHSFWGSFSDGEEPTVALINVSGTLYGTTHEGGAYTELGGTVFSLDPATESERLVYSFCKETSCIGGKLPGSALLDVNGIFYGTTELGGSVNHGTVFSVDLSKGTETVLYSFCQQYNCSDGNDPTGSLININGKLYGTAGGGAYCEGAIFSLNISTGKEKVVYSFQGGADGAGPIAGLIKIGTKLYGTTSYGGGSGCNSGCGTVFSFDLKTGEETVIHSFQDDGIDGTGPLAGLINVNGTMYGTTFLGGTYGYGTVYSITS